MSEVSAAYDVIVVGGGGSGLAAACAAAELGGRVLVIEKEAQPGGTTGIAVGSFTASRTRLQSLAGIQDDPADHAVDAGKFAPAAIERRNNDALRSWFLSQAADTLAWLEQQGLSFVGPSPEPPNRQPRMHNVVPGAKAYIATLQLSLQRLAGRLLCDTAVTSLILESGRVQGVRAQPQQGDPISIRATRGVILAGGDYANNPELIARYKGNDFRQIEGINPHATGQGHLLAEQAGAQMVNMDITYGPELRFVPAHRKPFQQWLPPTGVRAQIMGRVARRLPKAVLQRLIKRLLVTWQHPEDRLFDDGAILLNRDGCRFVDETRWPEREIAVAAQPGKIAYLLLDHRLIEKYSAWPHFISTAPDIAYAYLRDYQRLRPDVTAVADRLENLARLRGLDPAAVSAAAQALPAEGPSLPAEGPSLPAGGKWALLGPLKAYFTTTEGGALVNQSLQVLDRQQQVIPGLYAVGQNGLGGMILWSHGLHIAWAMTSGRLAGQSVMTAGVPAVDR